MFRWWRRTRSHDTLFPSHENSTRCFQVFLLTASFLTATPPPSEHISRTKGGNDIKVKELAAYTGWGTKTIYQLAKKEGLPIRYAPGKSRGGVVLESEFEEWLKEKGYMKGEK